MANSFRERLRSAQAQEMYQKLIPGITQLSDALFDDLKTRFSEPRYGATRTLTRTWITTEKFRANASVRTFDPNQQFINIAYGVAIDFRKDSRLFPEICTRHLVEDKYDELFAKLDYGDGPKNILPPDLDVQTACEKFFRISLAWLYLHEQSHLFQGHGTIFAEVTKKDAGDCFVWSETMSHDDKPLEGRAAQISHAFELAADYEATNLVIQLLLVDDKGSLKKSSLWLLIASLTCTFNRFYGENRPAHNGVASGTHPDPALRMRDTYRAIIATLLHPDANKYVPWAHTVEDVNAVMEHAFNSANLYWQVVHSEDPGFPEFMSRVIDDTASAYFQSIDSIWSELRPKVLNKYFGYGEGSVRPAPEMHQSSAAAS